MLTCPGASVHAHQPPACCTYQRRRAACLRAAKHGTHAVRGPALGVPHPPQALRSCAVDNSGLVGFDGFRQGIRSLAPGLDDGQLKALFDRHASVGLDAIAGPHAAQLGYAAFAKALAPL